MATKTKAKQATSAGTRTRRDDIDLRDLILQDLNNIERGRFSLNVHLYEAYSSEIFKSWGYDSFRDYIEKEPGMTLEYRVAMWGVQMGKVMVQHGITQDQVDAIGWTKFKEMTALMRDDISSREVEKMMEFASKHTFKEVQDFVKKKRVISSGGTVVEKTTLTFRLTNDQAEVVNTALGIAMKLADTDNMSLALEYICGDFQINHDPSRAAAVKATLHHAEETKVPAKVRADKGKKRKKNGKSSKKK